MVRPPAGLGAPGGERARVSSRSRTVHSEVCQTLSKAALPLCTGASCGLFSVGLDPPGISRGLLLAKPLSFGPSESAVKSNS